MSSVPTQSNRLHAYLSKFFTWCWDKEYVDPSPMVGLKKRFTEKPRKRHLDPTELKSLWSGADELGYPLGDWTKFILATGQRPGECQKLSMDDIFDDIWLVEGGDPKNSERHRIPLPSTARAIVEAAPIDDGPFVFSFSNGKTPMSQGGGKYDEIYEVVDLKHKWEPRDLRRTLQTLMSEELDVDPHLIAAICNQKSAAKPGVAKVYNQAKWIKQKRKALEAWNNWLLQTVKDGKNNS
jgi:integrase